MSSDLDSYNFSMDDCVKDVFLKYFKCHSNEAPVSNPFIISDDERNRIFNDVLKFDEEPPLFG